jgi:hypothetical protein
MSANNMLLPRGGYDFTQISSAEYRWSDDQSNLSALVMAPEGAENGWIYHVKSSAPACDFMGRQPSIEAAFRQAVQTLDRISQSHDVHPPHGVDSDKADVSPRRRLFNDQGLARMVRLLGGLNPQNS